MVQNDTINKVVTGVAGVTATEVAPPIIDAIVTNPSNVVQIVVQVIIAISTLVQLFKKKKSNPNI